MVTLKHTVENALTLDEAEEQMGKICDQFFGNRPYWTLIQCARVDTAIHTDGGALVRVLFNVDFCAGLESEKKNA